MRTPTEPSRPSASNATTHDDFDGFLCARLEWLRPELAEPEQRARCLRVLTDAIRGALNAALEEPGRLEHPAFRHDLVRLALGLLTDPGAGD